jgi:hypothetical protein
MWKQYTCVLQEEQIDQVKARNVGVINHFVSKWLKLSRKFVFIAEKTKDVLKHNVLCRMNVVKKDFREHCFAIKTNKWRHYSGIKVVKGNSVLICKQYYHGCMRY